jgi:hypothetical protein
MPKAILLGLSLVTVIAVTDLAIAQGGRDHGDEEQNCQDVWERAPGPCNKDCVQWSSCPSGPRATCTPTCVQWHYDFTQVRRRYCD